jgi:replication-associated recombination protein RarA
MAITANGYDMFELLSALQKCIRRNLEHDALFFAIELETFNPSALWNRLKVIASEDIGFAFPLMPILIETLEKQYLKEKSKLDRKPDDFAYLLFVSNAVVCLCSSQKSRITDDLLNVVLIERTNGTLIQIPDFALDMHTAKGRNMGRGFEHFFNEGSKLENEYGSNPWKERHRQLRKV